MKINEKCSSKRELRTFHETRETLSLLHLCSVIMVVIGDLLEYSIHNYSLPDNKMSVSLVD